MRNLCPGLIRQRASIEARVAPDKMTLPRIRLFAKVLTETIGMRAVAGVDPVVWNPTEGQYAGVTFVQPWTDSALQIHTWDERSFICVDIFTCKAFDLRDAVSLVGEFFATDEVEWEAGPCTWNTEVSNT